VSACVFFACDAQYNSGPKFSSYLCFVFTYALRRCLDDDVGSRRKAYVDTKLSARYWTGSTLYHNSHTLRVE
jgi:hypothetical protein